MSDLLVVTLVALAVAAGAMVVTALVARRVGRVNVVDVTWSLALTGVALAAALLSGTSLSWWVALLVAVWGVRLSFHIWKRSRGHGEDPRYAAMLGDGGFAVAVRKVFVVQGVAIWFVSLPLQAAAVASSWCTWLVVAGTVVWVVGVLFESVGDAQLAAYKRDPDRGPVMDRGLWAWSRHPNYFGDACVWWGIWLAAAVSTGWLPALLTVPAPAAMTYFLAWKTGAKLLEQTMMQRPGYPEYAARTSMFLPRPPRRS